MNIKEIEHMWKVATGDPNHDTNWYDPAVVKFAEMVAAAQRERNANTVEQMGIEGYGTLAIAAAIRAGGQQ